MAYIHPQKRHMKFTLICLSLLTVVACNTPATKEPSPAPIIGTWKLLSGTTIKGTDTTTTDYTKGKEMIKIITATHFSFLNHDLNHGKDSTASFTAGGGRVKIGEGKYTELLDYCNYREWEGGTFDFDYTVSGDSLSIIGIEKVEKADVNHLNIEKYIRVKQ